jgi:hypothetical protein
VRTPQDGTPDFSAFLTASLMNLRTVLLVGRGSGVFWMQCRTRNSNALSETMRSKPRSLNRAISSAMAILPIHAGFPDFWREAPNKVRAKHPVKLRYHSSLERAEWQACVPAAQRPARRLWWHAPGVLATWLTGHTSATYQLWARTVGCARSRARRRRLSRRSPRIRRPP